MDGLHIGTFLSMPDVVLPVLDEALALPRVLARLPGGYDPIVVDNASTDGSGDIAQRLGARVVAEPQRGFGAACFAGLSAASADVVCFMDCDGSLDPAELPLVADPVIDDRSDLVLGARRGDGRALGPAHTRIANWCLVRLIQHRAGVTLSDLGPMRAARRERLLSLELTDRRFGWPLEMVLRAARAGWRIDEVPVGYAPRLGRSKVTGTVRGTLRTVHDMARILR
jgi:glycosyltransferase involved in cell wall biosynthesis